MAHMARQPVVPGANDNLTGVAVLLEVARRLERRAPDGLRLLLLSTGSEESNQDGMLAFARRHFGELDRERTTFFCLDTVGSPELVLIEGEGFLRMRDYDAALKDMAQERRATAGVHVRRGLRFTFATDALVAAAPRLPRRRAGLRQRVARALELPLADRHAGERRLRLACAGAVERRARRGRAAADAARAGAARARPPRRRA